MLRITGYENGWVYYYCEECTVSGVIEYSPFLHDNCVFRADVDCMGCGNKNAVYITLCSDEAVAPDLLAQLQALKIKDGGQNHESSAASG